MKSFGVLYPPQHLVVVSFSFKHSSRGVLISHYGFNLHSPEGNDIEHFPMWLLALCLSSWVKCLFKFPGYLLLYSHCCFMAITVLFICQTQIIFQISVLQMFFSHPVAYLFILLMVLFDEQLFLIVMKSLLSGFLLHLFLSLL